MSTTKQRTRQRNRFGWLVAAASLLTALALTACGSSSGPSTAAGAPPAASPSPASAASATQSGTSSNAPYGGTSAAAAAATATATVNATPAPAASSSALAIGVRSSATLGTYLAAPDGRTLYVFLKDAPDASNCTGSCLQTWPPVLLGDAQQVAPDPAADGAFDAITIGSGRQVTYRGAPLYEFAGDHAAGDTNGEGVNGIWFVARPGTASTSVVGVRSSGAKTPYLVAPTGLSLYVFAKDTAGVSNCSGSCLANWPALTVPAGMDPTAVTAAPGAPGVLVREDGSRQVTYRGLPLYTFAGDHLPGDVAGDGVGGVWSLATP